MPHIKSSSFLCLSLPLLSIAQAAEKHDLTQSLMNDSLWETKISDFQASHKPFQFKWMSASKSRLRSIGKNTQTFGKASGELLVTSDNDGNVNGVSISFYNRGDNGPMSPAQFDALYKNLAETITSTTGSRAEDKSGRGTVVLTKTFWRYKDSAFQLEKSFTRSTKTPEFIRLRVASLSKAREGSKTARRSSLKANVTRDKNGDTFIHNVPMVDQGRKGYCVCASAARIYQYYGRQTDQHEIAQLANSTADSGTAINEMVASLKKVTGKLNSRIVVLYEYPKGISDLPTDAEYKSGRARSSDVDKVLRGFDEMKQDVNDYQRLAKKKKGKSVLGGSSYARIDRKAPWSFAQMERFRAQCDPKIYREVMMDKSSYKRFYSKVKEYIDQGIPLAWTLKLGMFPEPGIPQAGGGHMRLIIGYNTKDNAIIYSDSWGAGHEKKYMDAGAAFCMTSCLLAMPPTR
ncbi:C39 family peptidase [Rubritalea tangerina]|uniref:C39 family peptidase n=1 Tax=Rubritalea tangerina TaxID=430798 RepID=A0ABW4Z787_9BACT